MNKTITTLALTLLSLNPGDLFAGQPPSIPQVIYQTGFEGADSLAAWGPIPEGVQLVAAGPGGSRCVMVERLASRGPGHASIRLALPLESARGCRVKVEALTRAEEVTKPPNSWNGVKVMLHTVSPQGKKYEQQNDVHGTFDWRPVRFVGTVPDDATEAWLVLGLENTTGRVWFDDVKVTVFAPKRSRPAQPATAGSPYKGHELPRLRGAMIGSRVGAADLRVLGQEWKANHVRWQLIWGGFPKSPADNGDLSAYDAWLESELDRLDALLPVCREAGLVVLIDLHTPPGGRDAGSVCRIFQEERYQEKFLAVWEKIASRYRTNTIVWGYDLVNEPVEGFVPDGLLDWQSLALKTAQLVRSIAPDQAIVIEPAPWGGPEALENLEPLPVRGVVYSVHMYQPHDFTHQGVHGKPVGLAYPGEVRSVMWNKARLRQALQPVVEFQRDYNVHIYIGEFSAIRWAPGDSAHDYLRDLIEIFEEHGWDWAYHAYREWSGWSVEHGPDPKNTQPARFQTDREKLLRSWFEKNEKPPGTPAPW